MAQIPKTEKKLREARFFLSHMNKAAQVPHLDREDFDFHLGALLSAARSVTWVLQSEQKASYDAWCPTWRRALPEAERELMDFMNAQRVAEVHVQGVETRSEVEMVPLTKLDCERSAHPAYAVSWDWLGPPEMGVMVHYFESSGQEEKVVDKCVRYLNLLDRLVKEFNLEFP